MNIERKTNKVDFTPDGSTHRVVDIWCDDSIVATMDRTTIAREHEDGVSDQLAVIQLDENFFEDKNQQEILSILSLNHYENQGGLVIYRPEFVVYNGWILDAVDGSIDEVYVGTKKALDNARNQPEEVFGTFFTRFDAAVKLIAENCKGE